MGPHDDVTISALRRCQQFDGAIGYKNPSKKLYTTDQKSLDNILSSVASSLTTGKLVNATTIEEVLTPLEKWIKVEPFPKSLADYSRIQVNSTYPSLKPEDLPELVNAHLHSTFLAQYSDGISVLFPFADKLQALYQPALKLADRIAACPPKNPLPDSCPPNIPKCALCKKTAKINSINTLSDSTRTLTLGTIPHPFVTIEMVVDDVSLLNDPESLTLRYIRRTAVRDAWLKEVTKQPYMAKGIGSGPRATKIKELVASKKDDKFLSMWNTEKEGFKDTEWTLGFVPGTLVELNITLPLVNTNDTKTLADASAVAAKGKGPILGAIESWCMGDTEVWRFVNAWRQRRVVERADWTALEKKFGHGLDDDERRWGW